MQPHEPRIDPRVVDALVVVGVTLPGVIGLVIGLTVTDATLRSSIPMAVLLLVQGLVLWWRRRRPLAVLAVTVVALLVGQALGDPNASSYLGPYAAAYAVAAYGSRRTAVAGLAGLGLATVVNLAVVELAPAAESLNAVLWGPAVVTIALAWVIGLYARVRRDHIATLVAYANQLEVDRDEKARLAVLDERRRIARELHDQVAHHLGIAALQTAAARRWLDRDAERADAAMLSAEEAVRVALTTMPVILEALRTDNAAVDLSPQPTLRDVGDLITRVTDAGLPVELRVEGERRALNPAVELTAYRIVQEALTNILKHAGPARAKVCLVFAADRLEIEVADDGAGATTSGGNTGGLGLVGMRERVGLLGGTLAVGPRGTGGFTVRAVLPLAEPEGAR
jgi:signal transduction histidine kinase